MLLGLLTISCTPSGPCDEGFARTVEGDDNCYPVSADDTEDSTPTGTDSDEPPDSDEPVEEFPHAFGDPITTIDYEFENGVEWMDAVVVDETRAIVAGVSGWAWYDLENLERLVDHRGHRTYRVTVDTSTERAYFATRSGNIEVADLSTDSPGPVELPGPKITQGYHEDIAADGGTVLLGGLDEGLIVLDSDLNRLATISAEEAFGVALLGDRGVYADGDQLILLDMSDPTSPAELSRATLRGTGRDIEMNAAHVAVALGGNGVDVYEVVDDELVLDGTLGLPGSSFGVSLDGDWLWIAAWEVVGLAWLGEGGPIMVGHEPPTQSAMGIGAMGGVVALADWQNFTIMQHEPDLAGPEFHDISPIWVDPSSTDPVAVTFTNYGAFDLELELTPSQGFEFSKSSLTLGAAGSETVQLTPPGDQGDLATVLYTTNDPDEEAGQLTIQSKSTQAGSTHQDFELVGFTPPESSLETYMLSDYAGKVVLLDYFTTW